MDLGTCKKCEETTTYHWQHCVQITEEYAPYKQIDDSHDTHQLHREGTFWSLILLHMLQRPRFDPCGERIRLLLSQGKPTIFVASHRSVQS